MSILGWLSDILTTLVEGAIAWVLLKDQHELAPTAVLIWITISCTYDTLWYLRESLIDNEIN